ncbi:hypothetical protein AVEN_218202-1 [Araneus ventricosus]|uniref:Uncharacterized protein n=1 Tax=Araneus ventricosus TaxID=182803 RepID=A0A4Y2F4W3_ARAVE|nr:hypothetical protein AVEN_218202-1 [Araneus ventricosus]
MIGSSVDYVTSGGMRNVPVTKAVEHLYATTAKSSGCVLLASRPAYSYPSRRNSLSSFFETENCFPVCSIDWLRVNGETARFSQFVTRSHQIVISCDR